MMTLDTLALTRPDGTVPPVQPGRNGGTLVLFDSQRGREIRYRTLERKREELRRAALDAGDLAAAQVADLPSADRAGLLRAIFANHLLNAYDASARGSAASLRLWLEHAYPKPERERSAVDTAAAAAGQAIGVELARQLLDMLRRAPVSDRLSAADGNG